FESGATILEQGAPASDLLVLLDGEVEVLRDDVRVAKTAEPGAVFGEMAVLLGGPCTATVRALKPCTFATVDDAAGFLRNSPTASHHVAVLLARRLDALNRYLIDVKHQYEGHDHLGMVDGVLDTLMHRQPRTAKK
ncbi:MAG TPA: cyclic nucleotide-binding domain-containing protein, partial [Verrucomicrobiota bacterium]|nr:cyclic nucleotide-binding domain-containing protein [Verrucomicrobiota bacterium]